MQGKQVSETFRSIGPPCSVDEAKLWLMFGDEALESAHAAEMERKAIETAVERAVESVLWRLEYRPDNWRYRETMARFASIEEKIREVLSDVRFGIVLLFLLGIVNLFMLAYVKQ